MGIESSMGDSLILTLVFVTFPEESHGPVAPGMPAVMDSLHYRVRDLMESHLTRQTRGAIPIRITILDNPAAPESLWVADHPLAIYQDPAATGSVAIYQDCWPTAGHAADREIIYETLHEVTDAYDLAGRPWPFARGAVSLIPHGESTTWIAELGAIHQVGGLTYDPINAATFACLGLGLASSPDSTYYLPDAGELRPVQTFWWDTWTGANTVTQSLFHEFGHVLGLDHASGSEPPEPEDPMIYLEDFYAYGAYDAMRAILLHPEVDTPPLSFGAWSLVNPVKQTGDWYGEPEVIWENTRSHRLHDLRSGGGVALVSGRVLLSTFVDSLTGPGGYIDRDEDKEGFLLTYHAGVAEDAPVYPGTGLAIWHTGWKERVRYFNASGEASLLGVVWIGRATKLESAWGRWDDPGLNGIVPIQQGNEDPVNGYDNHDMWFLPSGAPARGPDNLSLYYRGSSTDFFSTAPGRKREFSYRTNPSSFGSEDVFRRSAPQNVPSSLVIEILEEGQDAQGPYAVLDILLAPGEEILHPDAGGTFTVGEPVEITWTQDRSWGWDHAEGNGYGTDSLLVIDTVDVGLLRSGTLTALATGVANDGSWTWTPGPEHAGIQGRIRLVFHNVLEPARTAADTSAVNFHVEFPRLTLRERSSATQIDTQPLQPYSAVAFEATHDDDAPADSVNLDLMISRIGGVAQLYENRSAPRGLAEFSPLVLHTFPDTAQPDDVRGLAVADVDNDGDMDLFAAAAVNPRLYRNDGAGGPSRFVDIAPSTGVAAAADASWSASWADVDRDGWVDLYVNRAGGVATPTGITPQAVRLLRAQVEVVDGEIADLDYADVSTAAGVYRGQTRGITSAFGDMDGDGDLDLFVGHLAEEGTGEENLSALYRNDNDGTFTPVPLQGLLDPAPGFPRLGYVTGAVWVDADRDGLMDLALSRTDHRYIANQPPANLVVLRNLGQGEFDWTGRVPVAPQITDKMQGLGLGDLDQDGWMDLVGVPAGVATAPAVLLNDLATAGVLTDQAAGLGLATGEAQGLAVADFNQDGDEDLYLGRGSEFYYQNVSWAPDDSILTDAPDRFWVKIRLRSDSWGNNRMGIGARITLHTLDQSYVQFVDGGSGRGGQAPGVVTFGLADNHAVLFEADVRWPDGYVQEAVPVYPNQLNTIVDDHPPGLQTNLVGMLPVVRPDERVDWVFHWVTSWSTDISRDEVYLVGSGTTLTPRSHAVDHSVIPLPAGGYYHELTLRDQTCAWGTTVAYTVSSMVRGGARETSPQKTKKITVCVQ